MVQPDKLSASYGVPHEQNHSISMPDDPNDINTANHTNSQVESAEYISKVRWVFSVSKMSFQLPPNQMKCNQTFIATCHIHIRKRIFTSRSNFSCPFSSPRGLICTNRPANGPRKTAGPAYEHCSCWPLCSSPQLRSSAVSSSAALHHTI